MIKEEEIKYYRQNVIGKYVKKVMEKIKYEEFIYKVRQRELNNERQAINKADNKVYRNKRTKNQT